MRRRREHVRMGKTACRQRESALCRLFDQEELAKEVLSWLTRWFGVASCRLVSKKFLSKCRQVEWASLILVTASRLNAIFVFGESGGLRQRISTTPWKRSSRLDPCAALSCPFLSFCDQVRREGAACGAAQEKQGTVSMVANLCGCGTAKNVRLECSCRASCELFSG